MRPCLAGMKLASIYSTHSDTWEPNFMVEDERELGTAGTARPLSVQERTFSDWPASAALVSQSSSDSALFPAKGDAHAAFLSSGLALSPFATGQWEHAGSRLWCYPLPSARCATRRSLNGQIRVLARHAACPGSARHRAARHASEGTTVICGHEY